MFKYGKKAGNLAVVALCLALVPIAIIAAVWGTLGPEVIMNVNSAGEVVRTGAKWEMLIVPIMGFMVVGATCSTALRQAKIHGDDRLMAQATAERYMRNAVVEAVVFILVTGVMVYGAMTGHGLGF